MTDPLRPPYIVLIDDNPSDVYLLRYALDQCCRPYDLEVLVDGEQALKFIHLHRTGTARKPEPCVIVLDLRLPRYDGIAVLRAIKQVSSLAHVPVLVFTAQANPEEEREMQQLGVPYQQKPLNWNELQATAVQISDLCKQPSLAV